MVPLKQPKQMQLSNQSKRQQSQLDKRRLWNHLNLPRCKIRAPVATMVAVRWVTMTVWKSLTLKQIMPINAHCTAMFYQSSSIGHWRLCLTSLTTRRNLSKYESIKPLSVARIRQFDIGKFGDVINTQVIAMLCAFCNTLDSCVYPTMRQMTQALRVTRSYSKLCVADSSTRPRAATK